MRMQRLTKGLLAASGMLVLILDSRTALSGMQAGIALCLQTLIPSLFPFFLLSILLTGNLLGSSLALLKPLGLFCGIPQGAQSLLAVGLLGGYPVGAQNVALAFRRGNLSKTDAQRMLPICNNAGPAFLFGIVGAAFDSAAAPWLLWLIHMAGALTVAAAARPQVIGEALPVRERNVSVSQALQQALRVMAQVCGWVILFRTLLSYCEGWFLWRLPEEARVMVTGLLELSNGCTQLRSIAHPGLRFMAASALLSFGGLCVTLQTRSVTEGLDLGCYFPGKIMQTGLSILLCCSIQPLLPAPMRYRLHPFWIVLALFVTVTALHFLRKQQKSSSIPLPLVV